MKLFDVSDDMDNHLPGVIAGKAGLRSISCLA